MYRQETHTRVHARKHTQTQRGKEREHLLSKYIWFWFGIYQAIETSYLLSGEGKGVGAGTFSYDSQFFLDPRSY